MLPCCGHSLHFLCYFVKHKHKFDIFQLEMYIREPTISALTTELAQMHVGNARGNKASCRGYDISTIFTNTLTDDFQFDTQDSSLFQSRRPTIRTEFVPLLRDPPPIRSAKKRASPILEPRDSEQLIFDIEL